MIESIDRELRSGTVIEDHSIILGVLPLKEADKLVHLMTLEHGRVVAVAAQAARSTKRFGAALEPMNHVRAHLRIPRDLNSSETPIWRLEKADLQSSFLHFRKSYAQLESGLFILRLVMDMVPEGSVDASIFKALGRFLRDSESTQMAKYTGWARVAFWTWLANHLGFGELSTSIEPKLLDKSESFVNYWHECLAQKEVDFKKLFQNFDLHMPVDLELSEELGIYRRWLELSGIHWRYFEQWIQSKKF